ncbi:MAG: hypothetical protein HY392_01640 [Candidatus Diapherotrites archaeon]|nr:hypothetical protein [Candidatus Diapherotrites archaeon]
MTKMNQSGQAFSVFKLLIAAIVAVFILALLLQILSNINPPNVGDPTDEAASKIKTLITKLGTPERTTVVTFEPGKGLVGRTIADKTGALSPESVCVMLGRSDNDTQPTPFQEIDGKTINYTGNSTIQRRLYILCDLENKFNDGTAFSDLSGFGLVDEAFRDGGIPCSPADNTNRYCVVSVIPTGT